VAAPLALPLRRSSWPSQVAVCLAAYLAYGATRWLVISDRGVAVGHARAIERLERGLGIAVEAPVQRTFEGTPIMWLLGHAYIAAQVVVVPAVLIWLYRVNRTIYVRLRDTVLATWILAVPIFWLFPVAPPRLSGIGVVDTVSNGTGIALNSRFATSFYNPLAAVPSLHRGFALAVSAALACASRHWWSRALAAAWTPVIVVAVVATGNHFIFDVVAGLAATVAGYVAGAAVRTRRSIARS